LKGIEINEYEKIFEDIHDLSSLNKKIWISPRSSFAIFNAASNPVKFKIFHFSILSI
jgi:hypothetical protein